MRLTYKKSNILGLSSGLIVSIFSLIGDLDRGMDKTTEKMSFVHKKLGVLLKTNGNTKNYSQANPF